MSDSDSVMHSPTLSRANSMSQNSHAASASSKPPLTRPPTASNNNKESKEASGTGSVKRGGIHVKDGDKQCNVQVVVRCRPQTEKEKRDGEMLVTQINDGIEVHVNVGNAAKLGQMKSTSTKRTFTFDHVFNSQAEQLEVYNTAVKPLVEEVLAGFNCTVFAYGQTGTGKTHTMEGDISNTSDIRSKSAGVIPRSVHTIFDEIQQQSLDAVVKCSFMEIYNEDLSDLLAAIENGSTSGGKPSLPSSSSNSTDDSQELRLMADPEKGVVVQGLEEILVRSAPEVFHLLHKAHNRRRVAETNMNKNSSRSHGVFTIVVTVTESSDEGEDVVRIGKLHLVDLAGSESIGRSGAAGQRATEAGNINKSLLTLGRVINALVEKSTHIPYRESKLTRLLQESLGGRAKTVIIATISPSSASIDETLSTLDYAYRAKNIKNKPQVNEKKSGKSYMRELQNEIVILKRELEAQRSKNGIILPADMYDSFVRQSKSNGILISELEAKIKAKELEYAQLEKVQLETVEKLTATTQERNTLNTKLIETEQVVVETNEKLHQTEVVLESTQQQLTETQVWLKDEQYKVDEQHFLLDQHVETEATLHHQAAELKQTADTVIQEKNVLHAKIVRLEGLNSANDTVTNNFESNINTQVKHNVKALDQQQAAERDGLQSIKQRVEQHQQKSEAHSQTLRADIQQHVNHSSEQLKALSTAAHSYAADGTKQQQQQWQQYQQFNAQVSNELDQIRAATQQQATKVSKSIVSAVETTTKQAKELQSLNANGRQQDEKHNSQLSQHTISLTSSQQQHSATQQRSITDVSREVEQFMTQQTRYVEECTQSLLLNVQQLIQDFKVKQLQSIQVAVKALTQSLNTASQQEQQYSQQFVDATRAVQSDVSTWLQQKKSLANETEKAIRSHAAATEKQYDSINALVNTLHSDVSQQVDGVAEQHAAQLKTVEQATQSNKLHIKSYATSHTASVKQIFDSNEKSSSKQIASIEEYDRTAAASTNGTVGSIEQHVALVDQHYSEQKQSASQVQSVVSSYVHKEIQHDKPTHSTPVKRKYEYPIEFAATIDHPTLITNFATHHAHRLETAPAVPYESVYAEEIRMSKRQSTATANGRGTQVNSQATSADRTSVPRVSLGAQSLAESHSTEQLETASVSSTSSYADDSSSTSSALPNEEQENIVPSAASSQNALRHTRSKSKQPEAKASKMRPPTATLQSRVNN